MKDDARDQDFKTGSLLHDLINSQNLRSILALKAVASED